jgi:hypothetical protein
MEPIARWREKERARERERDSQVEEGIQSASHSKIKYSSQQEYVGTHALKIVSCPSNTISNSLHVDQCTLADSDWAIPGVGADSRP